jgi:AraC-like DNA-binding protein
LAVPTLSTLLFQALLRCAAAHELDGPALGNFLERQAELTLRLLPTEAIEETLSTQVQTLLLEILPDGVPRMEQVAKRLGQAPRSLQRHLRDEGRSFKQLIEQLQQAVSQDQLRPGVSILDVAFLVGFSEVSAFHRAFKRWTGRTPGQWKLAPGAD